MKSLGVDSGTGLFWLKLKTLFAKVIFALTKRD